MGFRPPVPVKGTHVFAWAQQQRAYLHSERIIAGSGIKVRHSDAGTVVSWSHAQMEFRLRNEANEYENIWNNHNFSITVRATDKDDDWGVDRGNIWLKAVKNPNGNKGAFYVRADNLVDVRTTEFGMLFKAGAATTPVIAANERSMNLLTQEDIQLGADRSLYFRCGSETGDDLHIFDNSAEQDWKHGISETAEHPCDIQFIHGIAVGWTPLS